MTYTVFISHSMADEDRPVVKALVDRLRTQGISPYLAERDPQPGRSLSSKVLEQINGSDLVAVFWTKRGAGSTWVNQEIGAARAAGKLVVPFVERGVTVTGLLEGVERVEFDRDNPKEALESIESFVQAQRDARQRDADQIRQHQEDLVLLIGVGIAVALVVVLLLLAARE